MTSHKELFQDEGSTFDNHRPIIDAPDSFQSGVFTKVHITIGREMSHPNTTAHHIRWIRLFFIPEGNKYPYQIGQQDFTSHGASLLGPDTSFVYTHPESTFTFSTKKGGKLLVSSFCNIHGLWENSKDIKVD